MGALDDADDLLEQVVRAVGFVIVLVRWLEGAELVDLVLLDLDRLPEELCELVEGLGLGQPVKLGVGLGADRVGSRDVLAV